MKALLYTDGGARGNPSQAGIGAVLTTPMGSRSARSLVRSVTPRTTSRIEAIVAGIELALERGVSEIDIYAGSKLIVNQLNGEWKMKNEPTRGPRGHGAG